MAISKCSLLNRDARSFTLAVEAYNENRFECVLFEGVNERGSRYDSFYNLVSRMEYCFETIQYPKPAVIKRSFAEARADGSGALESLTEMNGKCQGRLGTFRIWVRHCQHASWQGEMESLETGERFFFESFLDLLIHMDETLTGKKTSEELDAAPGFNRLKQGLDLMAKGSGKRQENRQLMSNMLFCRQSGTAGQSATFTIQTLFHEHNSFQGSLNWNEGRRRVTFRSFLELIQLMESADVWESRVQAV